MPECDNNAEVAITPIDDCPYCSTVPVISVVVANEGECNEYREIQQRVMSEYLASLGIPADILHGQ